MNRVLAAVLACVSTACGAVTLTGPGDAVISAAEPLSLTAEPVRLGGEVQAFYDGLIGTDDKVVFRNVQLSDIQSASLIVGSKFHTGKFGRWLTAETCFCRENDDGTLDVEMQAKGPVYLMGCIVRFTQSGNDVLARVILSKFKYDAEIGSSSFRDASFGDTLALADDELLTGVSEPRCAVWKNLKAVLKSAPVQVPRRVVFENASTEVTNCPMESVMQGSFTNKDFALLWKDVDLAAVSSFSAMLGGGKVGNRWRQALPCNIVTNEDGTVKVRFNYGTEPVVSVRMLFDQRGADVWAKIDQAVYQWVDSKDPEYDFDGTYGWGADLGVIGSESDTVANTVSIKDIGCAGIRPSIWEESLVNDGFASAEWQTLLEDVDMEDVVNVGAVLGGSQLDGCGRESHILNVSTNGDGAVDSQYQYVLTSADGGKLVGAVLRYEQYGYDVRCRVWSQGYRWDVPLGFDIVTGYIQPVDLADSVGGTGVSLHGMTFRRTRKVLLPVTLGDFDCLGRPVKLKNVELRVDSTDAAPAVFSGPVYGSGRVVINGCAKIEENADFRLPVTLTSQAKLRVEMKEGDVSPLQVRSFSAEDGATLVLGADGLPSATGALSFPLVFAGAAGEIGDLNVELEWPLSGRYHAAAVAGDDGVLSVSLEPVKGMVVVIK